MHSSLRKKKSNVQTTRLEISVSIPDLRASSTWANAIKRVDDPNVTNSSSAYFDIGQSARRTAKRSLRTWKLSSRLIRLSFAHCPYQGDERKWGIWRKCDLAHFSLQNEYFCDAMIVYYLSTNIAKVLYRCPSLTLHSPSFAASSGAPARKRCPTERAARWWFACLWKRTIVRWIIYCTQKTWKQSKRIQVAQKNEISGAIWFWNNQDSRWRR